MAANPVAKSVAANPTNTVVKESTIPGLFEIDLVVHQDSRGYFKENWQNAKLTAAGLPEFKPVQHNIAFNEKRGTTRGLHAEPWNKLISVVNGSVFSAIVDLRNGRDNATVATFEIDRTKALFIPKGCANAYQTLADSVAYSYLVDAHWDANSNYEFINLGDPTLKIDWPIALSQALVSDKDLNAPNLFPSH